ncbi:hypothetical protein [Mucilaginibacter sp. SP1R1]|uniref:hypothetical protein n=1 Tax=Mucilaginibacter sp. SP1R1 TaxID=2723091 RepID=UPI00161B9324|nr:hypothetical protein [Mucilaginibacter sp. SP1R1]MBB6152481.1 hypothetical protein [Mucilaginibacter sp. SP1R1]
MTTLKLHRLAIACSLFLASCGTIAPDYLGDKYDPTTKTDVYYDAKDVKQSFKVIGHLSMVYYNAYDSDYYKNKMTDKAKSIGADAVIILQNDGHESKEMVRADAVKYN